MSAITNAAQSLARADAEFTNAVNSVAQLIARAFGEDPTFDEWEQGRDEFLSAYKAARSCTDKTADNRWSFVVKEMNEQFGLEKPRKPTAEAARKAEKRSSEAEKVDAIISQHGTIEELNKAFKKAEPEAAPLILKAMQKKQAQATKDATALAKEVMKQKREELRKLIGKVNTIKGLEALIALALKHVPQDEPETATEDASPASLDGVTVTEDEATLSDLIDADSLALI